MPIENNYLYIVATPIGNLSDLTPRAIETLKTVSLLAAEDTRHARKLLHFFGISTPCISLHEYNEHDRVPKLIDKLLAGSSIALFSDAGTPLISDPGYSFVKQAHIHHIRVIPIPGACALTCALSASGLATDRFVFEGFLPSKTVARKHVLSTFINETRTIIFYESRHRILASIADFISIFGAQRQIVYARELTKRYETIMNTTLQSLLDNLTSNLDNQKGEIVLLLAGAEEKKIDTSAEISKILKILLPKMTLKDAVEATKALTGENKKMIYQTALQLKS